MIFTGFSLCKNRTFPTTALSELLAGFAALMINSQLNKLDMYETVSTVCTKYKNDWTGLKAFGDSFDDFLDRIALIQSLGQQQKSPRSGITIDKNRLKQMLLREIMRNAGAVASFAAKTDNAALEAKMDYNPSDLKVREELLDDLAQEVHDIAQQNLASLADYGVTAETLQTFQTRIDAYSLAVGSPRAAQISTARITADIKRQFLKCDDLLERSMDRLVLQ